MNRQYYASLESLNNPYVFFLYIAFRKSVARRKKKAKIIAANWKEAEEVSDIVSIHMYTVIGN